MAQEWFYIVPREETIEKGGKGSGWFAPPKGTHTAGARARGAAAKPTKQDMQRAARVNTIADHSPSKLKRFATTSLLAARGVTEDVRTQYGGVKGKKQQRANLDNRIKVLDAELKRRGVDNPASAARKQWPDWKPMGKFTLTTGRGKTRTGAGKRKQPPNMKKWSKKQHQKAINALAKKPLGELRRRQDLVASQRKQALQQLKRTKDPTIKERLKIGLDNLDVREKHLIAAIDKKEFG